MKRIVSILLLVAIAFSLAGCGSAAPKTDAADYADQQAFLDDMAKGISERLKNVDDNKERTDEELYAYYEKLVNYELNRIAKYDSLTFEDSLFNELAHEYISGCKAQLTAAQHYKTLIGLWSAGASIRNNVIVYMYQMYDLPITSEEASQYSSGAPNYTITLSPSASGSDDAPFDGDAVRKKLKASHIDGRGEYGLGATLITNDSDEILEVNYTVKYYQGSTVVGTKSGKVDPVYPGQTAAGWDLDYKFAFTKTEIDFNSVSRSKGSAAKTGGKLSDIVTSDVSISGKNAIVELKNKGLDGSGVFSFVVVFYNKGTPVDVNHSNLKIDYGHSGTKTLECKSGSSFDSAEVFIEDMFKS